MENKNKETHHHRTSRSQSRKQTSSSAARSRSRSRSRPRNKIILRKKSPHHTNNSRVPRPILKKNSTTTTTAPRSNENYGESAPNPTTSFSSKASIVFGNTTEIPMKLTERNSIIGTSTEILMGMIKDKNYNLGEVYSIMEKVKKIIDFAQLSINERILLDSLNSAIFFILNNHNSVSTLATLLGESVNNKKRLSRLADWLIKYSDNPIYHKVAGEIIHLLTQVDISSTSSVGTNK